MPENELRQSSGAIDVVILFTFTPPLTVVEAAGILLLM